jgi:chemotaxis protein MotB
MSRLRKRKNSSGEKCTWLITMSDLMQLLLTFFVLLFSMSSLNPEKFAAAALSIQGALIGPEMGESIIESYEGEEIIPTDNIKVIQEEKIGIEISNEIIETYHKVDKFIKDNGLQADVRVQLNADGVLVDIKDAILFDTGSAQLKSSGLEVLKKLEPLINDFDNDIVVEGHTDNVPISGGQYPTNWELSAARALSVVRYLSEDVNIDPERLSARAYGEYNPIAPNDSPQNKALNRRVNLFIVFENEGVESKGGNQQ